MMTYSQAKDMAALKARSHECTDFGRTPFQIAGAVFNPRQSEFYVTADVMNSAEPVYFKVSGNKKDSSENDMAERIPYFLSCPEMLHLTWINPEYKPFRRIHFTADYSEIHDDPVNKTLTAKAQVAMPDGSKKFGTVRIEYD